MLAYAPNVSWLFPELPFAARLAAVADLGFEAIEFGFPGHADLKALEAARNDLGLRIVLFNQDVPVWDAANRGYLVDPKRRGDFQRTLDTALGIALRLGVLKVMLPSGVEVPGLARAAQRACMQENLDWGAPRAADAGVLLTIEVLNPLDNPGYFLTASREALEIVRELNHPNVRLQLDTYHLQLKEGHLEQTVRDWAEWIGHVQFADEPGRHEPGTGVIDFPRLETVLESVGYEGYIGLEYIPQAKGAQALAWVAAERRSLSRRGASG